MEPGETTLDPCYSDPCYSEDGVDLTLIRWMLSLTPAERLEFLEARVNDILTIRACNAHT